MHHNLVLRFGNDFLKRILTFGNCLPVFEIVVVIQKTLLLGILLQRGSIGILAWAMPNWGLKRVDCVPMHRAYRIVRMPLMGAKKPTSKPKSVRKIVLADRAEISQAVYLTFGMGAVDHNGIPNHAVVTEKILDRATLLNYAVADFAIF